MPCGRAAVICVVIPALLAFFTTTRFVRNIPFHLNPPKLSASFAHFPRGSSADYHPSPLEHLTGHSPSRWSDTERLAFCEDATSLISQGRSLVLLSCDPDRHRWNTVMGPFEDPDSVQGALWIIDPVPQAGVEPKIERVNLDWSALTKGQAQFHPLGLEVVQDSDASDGARLLVVNHGANESTLERFSLLALPDSPSASPAPYIATHLHTLRHPSLSGAPNSLAVLPSSSASGLRFFLSHDHHFNRRTRSPLRKVANFLETIFSLPLSRVDYVEVVLPLTNGGQPKIKVETVADGVAFANGVALSPDGDTLVMASTSRRELRFYAVAQVEHNVKPSLTLIRTVSLPMLVDNLSILPWNFTTSLAPAYTAEAGRNFTVLATGHPSYLALLSVAHKLNLSFHLPSFLSRLLAWPGIDFRWRAQHGMSWTVAVHYPLPPSAPKQGGQQEWETVFQSNGRVAEGGFGGSTTAIAGEEGGRKWLVVTGLYEEGVKILREKIVSG
ncbi:hypothetical protein JCM11641_003995 [Rhodosporidiobolus odoratus]